jgi:hypothetical protein
MAKGEKPILSIRIDAGILRRVDELAARADVGRAEVVERCLSIGLFDQESLVEWLKNPVVGAVFNLLRYPVVVKALGKVLKDEDWADPTSVALIEADLKHRRSKRYKPVVE